jgi:hypothetical protein
MRPLPQTRKEKTLWQTDSSAHREKVVAAVLLAMSAWTLGCGGGGAGSVAPSSPAPPSITVSITPSSGSVLLGESLSFSASVSTTTNASVTWSVNGVAGGSSLTGTITASGVYSAPADLPTGGTAQVTATSNADSSLSATANVTITSDISVSLSPNTVSVELGAVQPFQAAIKSQGQPDPSVRWSLAGAACPNACGSVDGNGNYTAPQILPSTATVNLIATSVADSTKQSTAGITIASHFTLQLSAPANVQAGTAVTLTATLTPVPGSNPSNALSWSLQGSGCTSSACGVLTVTTAQAVGAVPVTNTATYTAPPTAPQPATVVVMVTPLADPSKMVQANITILPGSVISISPPAATLAVNQSVTLSATQNSSTNDSLNWSVNGIPDGSYVYGQICVLGSNPCQPVASSSTTQVSYVAPGSIPAANPFSVTVSSASNPTLAASAQISVLSQIVVSVLPNNVTLAPLALQSFTATVLGSANQGVTWQLQGPGCGTAGSCGSVDASGVYAAPAVAPTPSNLTVVATSQANPMESAIASVIISSGPNIQALHPASVYASGLDGFTLQVDGSGFAETSPAPGSTLIIGGTARVTACTTGNTCTAAVTSADVAQPGNLSVQLQNPGGTSSNMVQLVVAAPNVSNGSIPLTSAAPAASGENIVVVEPTTAGIDSTCGDFDLAVTAIGTFNTSTNACNLGGSLSSAVERHRHD